MSTSRKVLSRRKALQDFYKILSERKEEGEHLSADKEEEHPVAEETKKDGPIDYISQAEALSRPENLSEFLKTAKPEEILKVRNSVANKLNHHDMEKKSMIYDNYYELIKLNQVLSNLSADKNNKKNMLDDGVKPVTEEDVTRVFGELSDFLNSDAALFNQDFNNVVELICGDLEDSDSLASVKGLRD